MRPAENRREAGGGPSLLDRPSPSRDASAGPILDHMTTQRRFQHSWTLVFAALLAGLAFTLVPSASADVAPPNLVALHAFLGDPLFGLDTPQGTLFGKLPDEETQMGSTTKVWTLDLTAHALAQGKVHLNDQVTIQPYEAGFGNANSLMRDVNGTPLEAGEIVSLDALVRGLIYQSGNNAAIAIARHVARAYYGPAADWQDFVSMMNAHAATLGQSHTLLSNPQGIDILPHHTTARELAEEFQHGLQDPYFASVVGFRGTYNTTTQGPNGPKTYSFGWGNSDIGWEGAKRGATPLCSGANTGCLVESYRRIGRRLVAAYMQGGILDDQGLFNFGFAQLFHADPHGTSAGAGLVTRQAVDCLPNGRAITAVMSQSVPTSLVLWKPDVDASTITKLQEQSLPVQGPLAKATGDVSVAHLSSSDFVVATRVNSSAQLSRWSLGRGDNLMLLASGVDAGSAKSIVVQPVYSDTFLTAAISPTGDLVLKSWRLQGSGLALLDTYAAGSDQFTEVAISGTRPGDVLNGRAVTASVGNYYGLTQLYDDVWAVDHATGKIGKLGELKEPFTHANVAITPISVTTVDGERQAPEYFAVGYRNTLGAPGDLELSVNRIDASGKPVHEGDRYNSGIPAEQVRLAPLATGGLMVATRDAQGHVQLMAWEVARESDDTIDPKLVSQHQTSDAISLDMCRVPSVHAEGDYVTSTRDLDGQLRLRAYRSADRPY
jgi:D-alanyl-D-alanine carboxypeptidase